MEGTKHQKQQHGRRYQHSLHKVGRERQHPSKKAAPFTKRERESGDRQHPPKEARENAAPPTKGEETITQQEEGRVPALLIFVALVPALLVVADSFDGGGRICPCVVLLLVAGGYP